MVNCVALPGISMVSSVVLPENVNLQRYTDSIYRMQVYQAKNPTTSNLQSAHFLWSQAWKNQPFIASCLVKFFW